MEEIINENSSNNSDEHFLLTLDMQIAKNIVQMNNIWLVKDIETGVFIPHYHFENKFVADKRCDIIRGFIKKELIELFKFKLNPESTNFNSSETKRFSEYSVSTNDITRYKRNPGYLNSLTKNIVQNIKDFLEIVKEEADFDCEPYKTHAANGIFDIKSGKLLSNDIAKLNRNIVNANYIKPSFICYMDEDGKTKIMKKKYPFLFYKLIKDALYDKTLNDKENENIVQSFIEILASFIIGNNKFKLVFILIGKPNTGKSTLLNILRKIFGSYAVTFNNSVLMVSPRTNNDIRPDIINLRGKRLMVGSESNKEAKFDVALLKALSGNDEVSNRKPHKGEMVNFTLSGKMMLATNFCPNFTNLEDTAFLNRLVLIDFNNIPEKMDTDLEEKIISQEKDLIFSMLADKAYEIEKNNSIYIHERFKANKQRILVNQNSSVPLFWKAHIRPYENYIPVSYMYKNQVKILYSVMYLDFCKRNDVKPLPLEAFGKEFKLLADQFPMVQWKKGDSNNYYLGFNVVDGEKDHYYSMLNCVVLDHTGDLTA